jgi:hypothetical protein
MNRKALVLFVPFFFIISFSGCLDEARAVHTGILTDVILYGDSHLYIYINNTTSPYGIEIINIEQDSDEYDMSLVYGICLKAKGEMVRIVTENHTVKLFEVYY